MHVTESGTSCAGIHDIGSAPANRTETGVKTVILTDSSRLPLGAATDLSGLNGQLTTLKTRPEVGGVVVDVASDQRIQDLNLQADGKPECPYAKNLVADALKDVVDSFRTTGNPGLKYVVLIGGDATIPFFRYPDEALLAPESQFNAGLKNTSASQASLSLNYVLSQDAYGADISVAQNANAFPVPDLAVGRLVETASEASTVLAAYLSDADGVVSASSSLVTGYDFLSDAADAVSERPRRRDRQCPGRADRAEQHLAHRSGLVERRRSQRRAARHDAPRPGVPRRSLQRDKCARGRLHHHGLDDAELAASTTDFTNSIVFSAGLSLRLQHVDPDASASVNQLDWAQALARKGATLIAGTGYQYGDTDFIMYSEQIYAGFAHQLRAGQRAGVGRAGAAAVQAGVPPGHAEPAWYRHEGSARVHALRTADAQRQPPGGGPDRGSE